MAVVAGKNAIDVGIVVNDITASLHFYCDIIGLEKVQEMPLWIGTMHRLAFGEASRFMTQKARQLFTT
jgi:catechol 2,3-dioxygenase-like lactoylglutathione lyase family enzyme